MAGSASAAVRTASVSLPAPYQPPSLSPQPPVVDTEPYLHTAAISYDDVAGTVTGSMSLYDPSYWAGQDSGGGMLGYWSLDMTLATDCATTSTGTLTDSSGATELTFDTGPVLDANFAYTSLGIAATLTGYEGEVDGTGTFDGTTYTGTVQSNAFVQLAFRCVMFEVTDNDSRSDGANWYHSGWEWIPGYAPVAPWVRRATGQTVRTLTRLANARHTIGFSSRYEDLTQVRVTNAASSKSVDKWAWANIKARNPKYRGNGGILFVHKAGRWQVVGGGSERVRGEPQTVFSAFFG